VSEVEVAHLCGWRRLTRRQGIGHVNHPPIRVVHRAAAEIDGAGTRDRIGVVESECRIAGAGIVDELVAVVVTTVVCAFGAIRVARRATVAVSSDTHVARSAHAPEAIRGSHARGAGSLVRAAARGDRTRDGEERDSRRTNED